MKRDQATKEECNLVLQIVSDMLDKRLKEHGWGKYAGPHETAGVLLEEWREMEDALQANDNQRFGDELVDIAVGAIFGIVSLLDVSEIERPPRGIWQDGDPRQEDLMSSEIAEARKVMREAFKNNPDLRMGYQANIAMLIYDDQTTEPNEFHQHQPEDLQTKEGCNVIADRLIKLIFGNA